MRRAEVLALVIVAGCYQQTSNRPVPVAVVNDACGANTAPASCTAAAGCEWRVLTSDCPAGATAALAVTAVQVGALTLAPSVSPSCFPAGGTATYNIQVATTAAARAVTELVVARAGPRRR